MFFACWNAEKKMTMAQIVIGKAGLFRAKEDCHAARRQSALNSFRRFFEQAKLVLQFAIAYAVVPITRLQSRVASATELNSSARARSGAAPTAETASRKAFSYGVTTRRWSAPKLLIARAAAPIFSGLRERTSTMRKFSS